MVGEGKGDGRGLVGERCERVTVERGGELERLGMGEKRLGRRDERDTTGRRKELTSRMVGEGKKRGERPCCVRYEVRELERRKGENGRGTAREEKGGRKVQTKWGREYR